MIRSILLVVALLACATAELDLDVLENAIYPAVQARSAVPWTHASVSEATTPLRLAFAVSSLEKTSALDQLFTQLSQRGHSVNVYTAEETTATFAYPVESVRAAATLDSKGLVYATSNAVFATLASAPHFDAVVFADNLGFVSFQAKQAGLAFSHTVLAQRVTYEAHSLEQPEQVVAAFMTRQCLKLADVLVTSSKTAPRSLAAAGVQLSEEAPLFEVTSAKAWVSFMEYLPTELPTVEASSEEPLVSVVIATYNRPEFLRECVAAIEQQTYSKLELVIVDDGSTDKRVAEVLSSLERHANVKIVRQTNQYLGAARNAGVQAATGELVLFMDDDNIAFPSMVATLVKALATSRADVAVNAHSVWEQDKPKSSARVWTPLGPAPLVGMVENVLGNANFMIRKSAFQRLGGFTTDRTGLEDYEFHAAAVLAHTSYVVVPRSLMFYRIHDREEQMYFETAGVEAEERALRPYLPLLHKTGHSTRDVHERKRVVAQTCVVVNAQVQSCPAAGLASRWSFYVLATQYADAYATIDGSSTYTATVNFGTLGAGTVNSVSVQPTSVAGSDALILDVTGPLATNNGQFGSFTGSVTLNTGVTNGYTLDLSTTCTRLVPALDTYPPCLCQSNTDGSTAIRSVCGCPNTGGFCRPLDFNGDGYWDSYDLAALILNWGRLTVSPNPVADINNDDLTGIEELAKLLFNWDRQLNGPATSAVPGIPNTPNNPGAAPAVNP